MQISQYYNSTSWDYLTSALMEEKFSMELVSPYQSVNQLLLVLFHCLVHLEFRPQIILFNICGFLLQRSLDLYGFRRFPRRPGLGVFVNVTFQHRDVQDRVDRDRHQSRSQFIKSSNMLMIPFSQESVETKKHNLLTFLLGRNSQKPAAYVAKIITFLSWYWIVLK